MLGLLLLAGCGGSGHKLNAKQAAAALFRASGHQTGDGTTITCGKPQPGEDSVDYDCTFFSRGNRSATTQIRENSHDVTILGG
jgi:hypothetical protein